MPVYRGGSRPDPSKYEWRDCRTCQTPFRVLLAALKHPRFKGLYCSRACVPLDLGRKVTKICPQCHLAFSYYPSETAGLTCGRKCPARVPDDYARIYTTAWRKRRKEAIARDNGQCQRCGDSPKSPDVHHIIPWAVSRDDSLENLVTLCRSCHRTVENLARYAS